MTDDPAEHPMRPSLPYPPEGKDVILDYDGETVIIASRGGGVTRITTAPAGIAVTDAFLDAAGLEERGEEWQCAGCRRTFTISWVGLSEREAEIRYCPQCGSPL